jgi:hypothetical protein
MDFQYFNHLSVPVLHYLQAVPFISSPFAITCRPLTFRILIFSSETSQPNELKIFSSETAWSN